MPPVFGPSIVVEDALVVLGRGQRKDVVAIGQDHERRFFAVEKFLDDHFFTGGTEGFTQENLIDGGICLSRVWRRSGRLCRPQGRRL